MADYSAGPVRDGDRYCSPWCGFGCTHAAFEQATREAEALCARMGEGWKPRVWENGGWHYEAVKGQTRISVNINGGALKSGWTVRSYSAWIEPSTYTGAHRNIRVQFITNADTPEDALGFAVQDARTHVSLIEAAVQEIA